MIKKLLAAFSTLTLTACLTSCSMTEKPVTETVHDSEIPPKMLFLGDSIAAGYGLEGYTSTDNYNCRSYSNILNDKYSEELGDSCEHKMVNKAVSGDTSQDLIDLLQSGDLDEDLKDCDAVVVSIGGNDLLGILLELLDSLGVNENGKIKLSDMDIGSAASSLLSMNKEVDAALAQFDINLKIISEELSSKTSGTVFVQTLYDPLEYYSSHKKVTGFSNEKIGKLNSIISTNSSTGYSVIDIASDFKGQAGELTNIADFDIHPNPAGHERIAEDVDAAFRAKGFHYTTTEEGKEKLTKDGKAALGGGIAGIIAVCGICTGFALKKKKSNSGKKEEKE